MNLYSLVLINEYKVYAKDHRYAYHCVLLLVDNWVHTEISEGFAQGYAYSDVILLESLNK